jgi:tripartite-type tricarboxylate transporter receptor subunit TctC
MVWKRRKALGRGTLILASALLLSLFPVHGHAAWPEKAIQWVVSFSPGGGSDVVARLVTKYMSDELGVPVNVINKPGGNQIPAINYVLNAPPDGYILLQEQQAVSAIKATLTDLPFKIEDRTFGPLMVSGPNAIVVNGNSPWNSLNDMLEAAKKDPASFTWVRTGGSSFTDMVNLLMFQLAGVDASQTKPVDFPGVGPGNVSVAGGHVMLGGGGASSVISLVRSGDLKALAVTGDSRVAALPDVPSAKEAGLPGLSLVNWFGVSGSVDLPKEVLDRLDEAARKICRDPAFIKDLESIASYPFYKPPADTRDFVLEEAELYRKLAATFGKK